MMKRRGAMSVCEQCHHSILFNGDFWDHVGPKLRHIAKPVICANCGSYNTYFEGPTEGYGCMNCAATDEDE